MYKKITLFFLALCMAFTVMGLAACNETVTYQILVLCGEHGSYSLSHESPVEEGTEVTLTLSPDEGYQTDTVTVNGETVTPVNDSYTFRVTSDTNISIAFRSEQPSAPKSYKIIVDCGANGDYELSHESPVEEGTEVTLTLIPKTDYEVESVTVNGEAAEIKDNVCKFTVTQDTELVLRFKAISYTVSVDCGEEGTYSLSAQNPVKVNTEVTLTVKPNHGYEIKKVTIGGAEKTSANGKYTFTVTGDVEIVITFSALPTYSVRVTCAGGGSYSLSPTGPYLEGTKVTLTLLPREGYEVKTFTVDGSDKTGELKDLVYTFTVEGETEISIQFYSPADEAEIPVAVTCGEGGSYQLSPEPPYHAGDEVTLTVTPDEDHLIDEVTIGGVKQDLSEETCTFTVSVETRIEITFKDAPRTFAKQYAGEWNALGTSGTLGSSIEIGKDTFTFDGEQYPVTENAGTFEFSVTDSDGDTTDYSFKFQSIVGGNALLVLTFTETTAEGTDTLTTYFLQSGVDYYTYTFPMTLVGNWVAQGGEPLTINEDGFLLGISQGIVTAFNAASNEYQILVAGATYSLTYSMATASVTLETSDGGTLVYAKEKAPDAVKGIPQFKGQYKTPDGLHLVEVTEDGKFYFDEEEYTLYPADSSGTMPNSFTTRMNGISFNVEFYKSFLEGDDYITHCWVYHSIYEDTDNYTLYAPMRFQVILHGEGGTLEQTPIHENNLYWVEDEMITATVTPIEGYEIDTLIINGEEAHVSNSQRKGVTFVYSLSGRGYEQTYEFYGLLQIIEVTFRKIEPESVAEANSEKEASENAVSVTDIGCIKLLPRKETLN